MTKPTIEPLSSARPVHGHHGVEPDRSLIARGRLLSSWSLCDVWRAGLVALVALLAAVMIAPSATAAAAAPRDLDGLPASLQKYVVGSQAWLSAPWMTAPSCRDQGGDFSVWVENVIVDTPELLEFFDSSVFGDRVSDEDRPRGDAILAGYRALAADQGVPGGYCVNDIKRWTGEDPEMKPFGFAWGMKDSSIFSCTDSDTSTDGDAGSSSGRNRWVGAERAPCDGFHLRCDGAAAVGDRLRCALWNVFSASYVAKVEDLRARAINAHPATGTAPVVEKTSTWKTLLAIAVPVALVVLAVLLGWQARARRRQQRQQRDVRAATGGGGDGEDEE